MRGVGPWSRRGWAPGGGCISLAEENTGPLSRRYCEASDAHRAAWAGQWEGAGWASLKKTTGPHGVAGWPSKRECPEAFVRRAGHQITSELAMSGSTQSSLSRVAEPRTD